MTDTKEQGYSRGSVVRIEPVDGWFSLTNTEAAPPYDWQMERVVAFVFRERGSRVALSAVTQGGDEPWFAHLVRGDERAIGEQTWAQIYDAGKEWFRPGIRDVTKLVRSIKGFEKDFVW